MTRRPTIKDVAEAAGVHPATASRALNPALPGRIAEPTASRVRAAAEALGYVPDPTARSLRTRRSGVVGVVIPDLTNPVLAPIVRAIEERLWDNGLGVLLVDTDNDPEREAALVGELEARRCEGMVIASATADSATVTALAATDLPIVLVTRDVHGTGLPFVGADDATGVAAAVRHLVELGHERIGYVTGPPHYSTAAIRYEAVRRTLEELLPGTEPIVRRGASFTVEPGRQVTEQLLRDRPDVTAILAGNDLMAIGAYEALAAAGLRVPDDISVAGHNDMPFIAALSPPLTTVAIPQRDIGAEAARLLLARLGGDGAAAAVRDGERTLLPTRLVVRGSTAPPRDVTS